MAKSDSTGSPMGYFVDSLFRKDMNVAVATSAGAANAPLAGATAEQSLAASRSEVTRIFMNTVGADALPAEDVQYVGQLVTQRTGLTQQAAEKRVSDTYARAQAKLRDAETAASAVAEKARKVSSYAALWLFISLLIGAFAASLAATYGGRRRDI
jgi:hypothetical protein